jgi:hypothetical protein
MSLENNRAIRLLISQVKTLKGSIEKALSDSATEAHSRFVSFKTFAEQYNFIANEAEKVLGLKGNSFSHYRIEHMGNSMNTLWGIQKEIMESVSLSTGILLTYLESATEFTEDEYDNLENFFKSKLRTAIFAVPQKEVEIQNVIESLLIGKGMSKGNDYDRESGKFEFSGKEYIPDFIVPKLNLCIEVKLLRDGKRSRIIDEINADITAYSKHYERLMFIVYDLGVIRDEAEFKRDIENAWKEIKVVLVKQ